MTGETLFAKELKKDWADVQAWRATHVGMWAWLLQRVSAILLVVLLAIHISYPYRLLTQFLLLMTAVFHAGLGIRVMVLDLGIGIKYQKALFWLLTLLGVLTFALLWKYRV